MRHALVVLAAPLLCAASQPSTDARSLTAPAAVSAAKAESKRPAPPIQWVKIKGGKFLMGSDRNPSVLPVTEITLKDYELSKTPVTNAQYKACVDAGACTPSVVRAQQFEPADHPMANVTWAQANAYAKFVGGRLPSESEWEFAALNRGQSRMHPWGEAEATCDYAVIKEMGVDGCGRESAWPVCSKPKGNTQQGLCDMAGNVWQWVADAYSPSLAGIPTDGTARPGETVRRMARGGAWSLPAESAMSHRREFAPNAEFICKYIGFRVAR